MSNLLSIDWHPSPNYSPAARRRGDVRAIVIHDVEGSLESALATFSVPGGPSAHYVIGVAAGNVVQCVQEAEISYHVAAFGGNPALNRNRPSWLPPYDGRYSAVNAATIGVELAGFAASGYTAAQYTALGRLVAGICERWAIVPSCLPDAGADATITTHGWLQTDRSDPGPRFDWDAFRAALDAAYAGGDTDVALSPEDTAILDVVHGLGANAASIPGWISALGALEEANAALAAQVATLLGEAQTAARRATTITVTYDDGTSQQVEVPAG